MFGIVVLFGLEVVELFCFRFVVLQCVSIRMFAVVDNLVSGWCVMNVEMFFDQNFLNQKFSTIRYIAFNKLFRFSSCMFWVSIFLLSALVSNTSKNTIFPHVSFSTVHVMPTVMLTLLNKFPSRLST